MNVRQEYRFLLREVEVPALFETILGQIGIVVDKDFGLRFVPKVEIQAQDLLSPSELFEYSQYVLYISNFGLRTTKGLPNPKDCGSLGAFAANMMDNGDILSYRKDHPVYGFVAACFEFNHLLEIIGGGLRIKYGSVSEFESVADTILAASVGADGDD
jgi:hypothetical protein